jgi:hypothetical protein
MKQCASRNSFSMRRWADGWTRGRDLRGGRPGRGAPRLPAEGYIVQSERLLRSNVLEPAFPFSNTARCPKNRARLMQHDVAKLLLRPGGSAGAAGSADKPGTFQCGQQPHRRLGVGCRAHASERRCACAYQRSFALPRWMRRRCFQSRRVTVARGGRGRLRVRRCLGFRQPLAQPSLKMMARDGLVPMS